MNRSPRYLLYYLDVFAIERAETITRDGSNLSTSKYLGTATATFRDSISPAPEYSDLLPTEKSLPFRTLTL